MLRDIPFCAAEAAGMMENACADEISAEILDLQRNDTESGREFADPAAQQNIYGKYLQFLMRAV